ncbi:MAG: hypothetical protein K8J08_20705 [Thermoanaerobaculia bacterium]|nr:hypothetical protein [Thermoanaerobaculia bacterium]
MTRRILVLVLLALGAFVLLRPEASRTESAVELPDPWPPNVDETYPDLELIDQDGETFNLSSLRGKALIIEPIGMNCPACQGFSGGNDVGGLGGFRPQQGALALEKYLRDYAPQVSPSNPDLVLVQLHALRLADAAAEGE